MQLKDIKITSLSITGNQDGSENLHISVAYGEGDKEVFLTKSLTRETITVQHLMDTVGSISETAMKS
jgi:hypothetical protein